MKERMDFTLDEKELLKKKNLPLEFLVTTQSENLPKTEDISKKRNSIVKNIQQLKKEKEFLFLELAEYGDKNDFISLIEAEVITQEDIKNIKHLLYKLAKNGEFNKFVTLFEISLMGVNELIEDKNNRAVQRNLLHAVISGDHFGNQIDYIESGVIHGLISIAKYLLDNGADMDIKMRTKNGERSAWEKCCGSSQLRQGFFWPSWKAYGSNIYPILKEYRDKKLQGNVYPELKVEQLKELSCNII